MEHVIDIWSFDYGSFSLLSRTSTNICQHPTFYSNNFSSDFCQIEFRRISFSIEIFPFGSSKLSTRPLLSNNEPFRIGCEVCRIPG